MREYYQWDLDAVLEVASLFDSMVEFRKAYSGAYKFATRHGHLEEVRNVVIRETTDIEELKRRVTMELDSSRRHFLTANKTRMVGTPSTEEDSYSEAQMGNYLDHDITHWEQAGEEREERALHWISKVIEHGTEADVAEVWRQFQEHQEFGRRGSQARRARRGTNTQRQGGK